ncbi:Hypothetical protein D9617_4g004440 [Elsinoe fawcettii]|nr:Hypothetical protein D9617_4g004440 [Elsinoe fawcettii]
MPDDDRIGIKGNMLSISAKEVEELFKAVVKDVSALIRKQLNTAAEPGRQPRGILLVGGFGQSAYLYDSIKKTFVDSTISRSVKRTHGQMTSPSPPRSTALAVLKPVAAWTAVVRGAALSGMSGIDVASSRKARRHYGVLCRCRLDPKKHSESNKVWDEVEAELKAENQLPCFIQKSDEIRPQEVVLESLYYTDVDNSSSRDIVIYCCDDATAPSERIGHDPRIYEICSIPIEFTDIPEKAFKQRQNRVGKWYSALTHKLGIRVGSGELRFDFRVKNRVYGYVDARFESAVLPIHQDTSSAASRGAIGYAISALSVRDMCRY